MKSRFAALALMLAAGLALGAPPRTPKADHPILGAWTFMVPGTNCQETYYLRPGEGKYQSGFTRP